MRVIYVLGCYRSGTTHAYRIAQALLEATMLDFGFGGANEDTLQDLIEYHRGHDAPVLLIKAHNLIPPEGGRIIYCQRNDRDTLGSYIRIGGDPAAGVHEIRKGRQIFRQLKPRLPALLDYDQLYRKPVRKVQTIAAKIGMRCSNELAAQIATETSVTSTYELTQSLDRVDAKSELRPGHVSEQLGVPGCYPLSPEIEAMLG